MRRLLVFVVIVLAVTLLQGPKANAVSDHLFASCSSHDNVVPMGGGLNYQTFTAQYDRISRYGFYLGGNGNIDLAIRRASDDQLLVLRTIDINEDRFYTMTITDPIEVTVGEQYEIYAQASDPGQAMGISDNTGCFAGSNANVNGFDAPSDLHFAVYGYNQSELDATPTPAPETNTATATPEEASADSEQYTSDSSYEIEGASEPSSEPSAGIGKATNVKAKFDAKSNAVELTWKKPPTAEVDGYRIFRSEEKARGFKQIGKTDQKTLGYTDKAISGNKTYYYFIRAYSGSEESFSSETVAIDIPALQAKAIATPPVNTVAKENNWFTDNLPYTVPGSIILLGGLGFLFWKFVLPRIRARFGPK